ncbi:OmpA family protein [Mangrovicoccus sp. HB161399]|uniref:OmpA family protein n=1 Tax=Mangrovicoccus sp. HB161399 TaxID=2720392 RepID=UPI00352D02BD
MTRRTARLFALLSALLAPAAHAGPFGNGWTLDGGASSLQFQSIKNGSKIEISSFATYSGTIDPSGHAELTVLLDSVDTKVDLRNVRMRFLFFETFEYPQAKITATIPPDMVADLAETRRKTLALPFAMELHGVTRELEAQVALTLIGDDLVSVATAEPVTIQVADFNLAAGLKKLEETANVTIVPATTVNFNFIFRADAAGTPQPAAAAAPAAPAPVPAPASAALEAQGDFSLEACVGRFEILSRTDNISFESGSARLRSASFPLLDQVADIVNRCPGLDIVIAGHTDSVGDPGYNQKLSELRAAAVVDYLLGKGVGQGRMTSVGYGEARPVAGNGTPEGRLRNRRIEFSVEGG